MCGIEFLWNLNWNVLFISGCSFLYVKKIIGGVCWWCMVSIDRGILLRFEFNVNFDCYYRCCYIYDVVDLRIVWIYVKERIWYLV